MKDGHKSLGRLLDQVEKANQEDVKEVTSGHLNESKLRKPKYTSRQPSWKGGRVGKDVGKGGSDVRGGGPEQASLMTDKLKHFSLGGNFLPKVKKDSSGGHFEGGSERIFVEELGSHASLKGGLTTGHPGRKNWASLDNDVNDVNETASSSSRLKFEPTEEPSGRFAVADGVTKNDQYRKLKSFEASFLRKYEASERRVLSGDQAVAHLTEKLKTSLSEVDQSAPSFHRLQLHSDVFEDLIEQSPVFGHILHEVKEAYDAYVAWLLEHRPTDSRLLKEQVINLHSNRVSEPEQLKKEEGKVRKLERDAKVQLEINERLRADVSKEWELSTQPNPNDVGFRSFGEEPPLELADQLEDLHATILERMDAIAEMRKRLREDYVPSAVVQQLEQCSKDTEIEIQRLAKQNDMYEHDIREMEESVQGAVRLADTSSKDRTKLWEGIRRVKVKGCKRPFTSFEEYSRFLSEAEGGDVKTNLCDPYTDGGEDNSGDEEENDKWTWYIS